MTEKEREKMIKDKGLDAPRVTPELVESKIVEEYYHIIPNSTLMICAIKLENGYMVTGESAAASPENFDEEVGMKVARQKAVDKVWMLEGYLLREKLHKGEK
jgi:hypothetical protein